MQRRSFIIGPVLSWFVSLWPTTSHANDWLLVTRDEFDREMALQESAASRANDRVLSPRTSAGGPVITVRQPDQSRPIESPVSIRIAFRAQGDATIDIRSFRALYGSMKLDVTQRLLEHATISEDGLSASNAQLPPGHHSMALSIADNKHRVGGLTVHFSVLGE